MIAARCFYALSYIILLSPQLSLPVPPSSFYETSLQIVLSMFPAPEFRLQTFEKILDFSADFMRKVSGWGDNLTKLLKHTSYYYFTFFFLK